jgi:hypothetical protein
VCTETLVEPPYSPAWLFRKGGIKYAQDRFGRYRQTRQLCVVSPTPSPQITYAPARSPLHILLRNVSR